MKLQKMILNKNYLFLFLAIGLFGKGLCLAADGQLSLETTPSGAEIWYAKSGSADKKYLGDSPLLHRNLPTGKYDLLLISADHDSLLVDDVEILPGQQTEIRREMNSRYGTLELQSWPDSLTIWLDGTNIGQTPYTHTLMLPGTYALKLSSPRPLFKPSISSVTMGKGDTIHLKKRLAYRDKNFLKENLGILPWHLQLEGGLKYSSISGAYDTAGKVSNFATSDKLTQWDYPVTLRLGLPYDIETHLLVPFNSFAAKDSAAPHYRDLKIGAKYTLREYNVGFDASYSFGLGDTSSTKKTSGHNALSLSLIALANKDKIMGFANAGYTFNFNDKLKTKLDPGDEIFLYAQVGYLLDSFMPYLGINGNYDLVSSFDGKSGNDASYVVTPEVGFTLDFPSYTSVQLGIPFTVIGKSGSNESGIGKRVSNEWGMHFSLSVNFGID